jgi:predicted DsbA family dithiol-disulfide isomerase
MAQLAEECDGASVRIELHRVPFFLEPWYIDEADDFWEPHYTRQTRKFGSVEAFERVKAAHQLMPRAIEAGLDAEGWTDENLDNRRQSSTLRAHRLIRWIDETKGWEKAEAAYACLHAEHFVKRGLLNDIQVLTRAAVSAGVDAASAEAFLRSDELASTILKLADDVHRMGIHSIPTLFINGRPALSGAAGKQDVLDALRQARSGHAAGSRCF